MKLNILSGIYSDDGPDLRTALPVNMVPVPKQTAVNKGYLRPAEGVVTMNSATPGKSRGGINWNGRHFRVLGTRLCLIGPSGAITELGFIPGSGHVTMDYSFDYLSISAGGDFYLYKEPDGLSRVTDPDLGPAVDHIWVDGYFMTTDGESLVVSELSDPFSVLPTKYGSSEADPDPVVALLKLRNEPCALNRYTVEVFDNVGGTGFPFQRVDGAQIQRGCVGTHACTIFIETITFLGGGRNEGISVWAAQSGSSTKIATREVDQILGTYTGDVLSNVVMEAKVSNGHEHLLIHLPDKTLVYDAAVSRELQTRVWFVLSSGFQNEARYLAQDLVYVHDKWWVGNPDGDRVGYLDSTLSTHWESDVGWEITTDMVYNENKGALVHEVELVCLSGRVDSVLSPKIYTQYSKDGVTWSQPKFVKAGRIGNRNKRIVWLKQGSMQTTRVQRFKGTSRAHMSVLRVDARLEPLGV